MKKTYLFIVVALLTGCGQTSGTGTAKADTEVAAVDTKAAEADSVSYDFSNEKLECKVTAPVPEEGLRQAVGEWMDELLGGTYPGDASDIKALTEFYGVAHRDSLSKEIEEDSDRPLFDKLAYEARVEKTFESPLVASFNLSIYINLGGAHPSSQEYAVTFRKSDGRRLSWDIIRHYTDYQFKQLLKEYVKEYMNVETDEEMARMLFDGNDVNNMPWPLTPPQLTAEGIAFVYQQYEIAPYALGMPSAIIPYSRVKPLLTEQAKMLIP